MFRLFSYLLEGEPDFGGGTISDQLDPSPVAGDPLPPAGDGEPATVTDGEPAADEGEQLEGGDDAGAPAADDYAPDPETAATLYRAYRDHIKQTPEYQEDIRAEQNRMIAQMQREAELSPASDPEYLAATATAEKSFKALQEKTERIKDEFGEAEAVSLITESYNYAAAAVVTRQQQLFTETDATLNHVVQELGIELPDDHPAHAQYSEALEMYARMRRGDAKAREGAYRAYSSRALKALATAAIEHGAKIEREKIGRERTDRQAITSDNKVTEAIARAARRHTPPAPNAAPTARPRLDRENLLAGDWRQTQKLMQEAGITI